VKVEESHKENTQDTTQVKQEPVDDYGLISMSKPTDSLNIQHFKATQTDSIVVFSVLGIWADGDMNKHAGARA